MADEKRKKGMTLSTKIIIGLLLGLLVGLFLGEYAYPFDYLGRAFIGLLQMTVLPYIVFSLIKNIGQLSLETGRRLIIIGLKVLGVLLVFGLLNLLILQLAFPVWESSSFFSLAFTAQPEPVDFVKLYIPSNPFYALSANQVPAVVLFSIVIGVGLMKVPNKQGFINALDVITNALNQVNKLVIKLTPLGVFAIAAATVGTVSWEQLGRLQAFILVYTAAVLIISLWVLPAFIAAVTPFTYRDIFKYTKATLLTIFATGKIIVVLPQLIDNLDELFKSKGLANDETNQATDILMPLAYPFPNLGSLIILIFVPFAAWFAGSELDMSEMPVLMISGLLSSFIAPVMGIPFMLDLMDISKDMFQLFFVSSVYTDRIRVVMGAMHLMTLTIIATAIYQGIFKMRKSKLLVWATISVVLYFGAIIGLKQYLTFSLKDAYNYDELVYQIPPRFEYDVVVTELEKSRPNPIKIRGWQSRLTRIRSSGVLRVGIIDNYLPFSYRNNKGELVGYDIEMAKMLAESLRVKLIFVPVNVARMSYQLNQDHYDIIMSGIPLSSELAEDYDLSHSYMDVNLALLTKAKTSELKSYAEASKLDTIRVAYARGSQAFLKLAQSIIPTIGGIRNDTIGNFILADTLLADAQLVSAETGAYYSLLEPEFSVVNPFPEPVSIPLVYVVGFESEDFLNYLNNWIIVTTKQGRLDKLYDHWILGKQVTQPKRNWSIIEDVLHWVGEDK
jgi:Na+/H+-dicarboxylate symporter/ABC-type amino acid transport substrate-binding protein